MTKRPADQYLDMAALRARYRVSDRTIWNWIKNPHLGCPRPFKIGRRSYWSVAELDAWDQANGAPAEDSPASEALGRPIVSEIIQTYEEFVAAMRSRRETLKLAAIEADALGGLQEGYTNKLENWSKDYGRGLGPEAFPLWLGAMRVGIVLIDLPRRPYVRRKAA